MRSTILGFLCVFLFIGFTACASSSSEKQQPTTGERPAQAGKFGDVTKSPGQAQVRVPETQVKTVLRTQNIPAVKVCAVKADINRMKDADFEAIGFPKDAARNIVQARRDSGGRFSSVQTLAEVPGVDPDLLDRLSPDLAVG